MEKLINIKKNKSVYLFVLLVGALFLKLVLAGFLEEKYPPPVRLLATVFILGIGAVFVLRGTAGIIEETTHVLSQRTKLASGLLQALGTAFPDMVLGVVAALVSLSLLSTDYTAAINFAIIAAATTFGSNIFNIGHALWCVYRQNVADNLGSSVMMLPYIKKMGEVRPIKKHQTKPSLREFDTAIDVLNLLTILTATVALSMVLFGKVANPPASINGDLYQLVRPAGFLILAVSIWVMYYFRHAKKEEEVFVRGQEANYYSLKTNGFIFLHLALAGVAILFSAESMVHSVETFCSLTGMPFVIAGVFAGVIGCLGEMIVIHNFTVHPRGRLGDAIVGVAMDNIITTMGASIVAIMGGIFLGGNALILIFVIILTLNTMLIWQISRLKNYFLEK